MISLGLSVTLRARQVELPASKIVADPGGPPFALPNTDSLGYRPLFGGPKKVWLPLFRLIKGRFLMRVFRSQPLPSRTHGYRTPALRGTFQKVGPRIRYWDNLQQCLVHDPRSKVGSRDQIRWKVVDDPTPLASLTVMM